MESFKMNLSSYFIDTVFKNKLYFKCTWYLCLQGSSEINSHFIVFITE